MSQMVFLSNAANGYAAHDELERQLRACLEEGYLSTVIKEYRVGCPGYTNEEQFYAPFMIQFNDRQRWIVYSTTSCRTDRIKGQQWDSENLKRLDASIVKAFLVYPDDVVADVRRTFVSQQQKYSSRSELSYLDEICSVEELVEKIRYREDDILRELAAPPFESQTDALDSDEEIVHAIAVHNEQFAAMSATEIGRDWDIRGRSFEKGLAKILNDATNLRYWKGLSGKEGVNYAYFKATLDAFGLRPNEVVGINASAEQEDIGLLPHGGQPKTDVMVTVTSENSDSRIFTISCKRTNRKTVSAHQYTADNFADVLDRDNVGLRNMLHAFQRAGSLRAMASGEGGALAEKLAPYVRQLCAWVLGGYGGEGDPQKQFAQYVALYRPIDNTYVIHDVQTYIDMMMALPMRNFSTPFSWTFASGQRGRSIQLKMPVLV